VPPTQKTTRQQTGWRCSLSAARGSSDDAERDILTADYFHALERAPAGFSGHVPEKTGANVAGVLRDVLQEISGKTKCGARWNGIRAWVGHASLYEEKTDSAFELGVDLYTGVYYKIGLSHLEELRHVDDSFWELMLSFSKLGKIKYDLAESPKEFACEEWEHELVKFRKSKIFAMVIDYALVSRHEKSDFGDAKIELEWVFDNGGWRKLLPVLVEATQIGWRMNYMLYRSAYQKKKRLSQSAAVSGEAVE
jgi:hypothetical protein